mmetsp:Transcript_44985/g.106848  ORF Transcript_44985/g.106848 Transcript_44985/m.106848 type:complete len:629 (+) Transcript_44985:110-1996(+)
MRWDVPLQVLMVLVMTFEVIGHVIVDLNSEATDFPHYWKRCVGSGHMLLATRADYQAHLTRARQELGFTGVRGHGILDDDMSVVPRKGEYEFFNVDTVYDFLLSIGVRPVVELSFMPKALVDCEGTDCHYAFRNPGAYKGLIMPPTNYTDWYDLVQSFALHLIDRYGIDEVAQWHFEVWNEFWGVRFPEPYMELYKTSVNALKAVNPKLRVGGPASLQTLHVSDFMRLAKEAGVPFDFVSTHLYPTDPQCGANNLTCFERMIMAARDAVKKHSSAEFLVTEYNAGLFLQEKTDLDSPAAAAFIFRQIAALEGVDMLSWWTFTDIFEETWMRSAPFQNGYGLMTIHGVPKPSWRAFELLADAGSRRLEVRGAAPQDAHSTISVLATTGQASFPSSGQLLSIYVSDWRPPQPKTFSCSPHSGKCVEDDTGSFTDLNVCEAACHAAAERAGLLQKGRNDSQRPQDTTADRRMMREVADSPQDVSILILHPAGVEPHASGATMVRVDDEHSNPKALWTSWGRPQYLKSSQVAALQASSVTVPEDVQVLRVNSTASRIVLKVAPNSAARIVLPVTAVPEDVRVTAAAAAVATSGPCLWTALVSSMLLAACGSFVVYRRRAVARRQSLGLPSSC